MLIFRFILSLTVITWINGRTHPKKHHKGGHHRYSDECPCGISDFVEERVIYGEVVKDYRKYPWIVGVISSHDWEEWGSCAGALISPTFVLTAGHCFPKQGTFSCWMMPNMCRAMKERKVQIGLLGRNKYQPLIKLPVKRIIVHPEFELYTPHHDIALVELQISIPCTPYSKPICVIPPKNIAGVGQIMHIAGFGKVDLPQFGQDLREGTSRIANGEVCRKRFVQFLPSEELCGMPHGNTTVCMGDSGSSSFIQYKHRFYSVGVVSYGDMFCPTTNVPAVFMRTDMHFDFIRKYVKDLPRQPNT